MVKHHLLEDGRRDEVYPVDAMFIQDGNALFHTLTNLPPTFGGICLHILDLLLSKRNFGISNCLITFSNVPQEKWSNICY